MKVPILTRYVIFCFLVILSLNWQFCSATKGSGKKSRRARSGTSTKVYDIKAAESLYDKLFNNCNSPHYQLCNTYNTELAPITQGKAVEVEVQTYFIELIEFDSKAQILKVAIWLQLRWDDSRLTWNADDENDVGYGIDQLTVEPETIWKPDMTLYDGVNQEGFRIDNSDQVKAIIRPTGYVSWTPLLYHEVSCPMNSKYFPFDVQICYCKWGSWSADNSQIDLKLFNNSEAVNDDYQLENVIFELSKSFQILNEITYPSSGRTFQDIKLVMYFTRNYRGFILTVLLNSLFLCLICLISFLIPIKSGERLSLSLSVVIAITVYQIIASDMLPIGTDSIPTLSIFLFLQCLMVYFSVFVTMINMQLECRGHTDEPNQFLFDLLVNKIAGNVVLKHVMKIHDLEIYKKYEFLEKRMEHTKKAYQTVLDRWHAHQEEKQKERINNKYVVIDLEGVSSPARQRWIAATSKIVWNIKNRRLKKNLTRRELQMNPSTVKSLKALRCQDPYDQQSSNWNSIDFDKIRELTDKARSNYTIPLERQLADEKWNIFALALDRICMIIYFLCFVALGVWCLEYANAQERQIEYYDNEVLPAIRKK